MSQSGPTTMTGGGGGGGSFPWTIETADFPVVAMNGYFADGAGTITGTLPAGSALGDTVAFAVTQGVLVLQAQGSDVIVINGNSSTGGGTQTSNALGDSVILVSTGAGVTPLQWISIDQAQGTWTPA